jgi:hypothetical protein
MLKARTLLVFMSILTAIGCAEAEPAAMTDDDAAWREGVLEPLQSGASDVDLGAWYEALSLSAPEQPTDIAFAVNVNVGGTFKNLAKLVVTRTEDEDGTSILQKTNLKPLLPSRISTDLMRDLVALDQGMIPDRDVEVAVTFKNTLRTPRYPELISDEREDSPRNAATLSRMHQLSQALVKARKPGLDRISRELTLAHGAKELERFSLIHGLVIKVPLNQVRRVMDRPDVTFLAYNQLSGGPGSTIANGRAMLNSDAYRSFSSISGKIASLDTGVRATHIELDGHTGRLRDCYGATDSTCSDGTDADDDCLNHGTGVANILVGSSAAGNELLGVTNARVDSFKVLRSTGSPCISHFTAAGMHRGFQAAINFGNKVITTSINTLSDDDNHVVCQYANEAFDAGAIVVALAGNSGPGAGSVGAPARATKVLGVGAIDTLGNVASYSSRGTAADGRVKPDLAALGMNLVVASNQSDGAFKGASGTSLAAPFVAGAAYLFREFIKPNFPYNSPDPGQMNAFMIALATGNSNSTMFTPETGAGPLRLQHGSGNFCWAKMAVTNHNTASFPCAVSANSRIGAALWWPELPGAHNDVDLKLVGPSGTVLHTSEQAASIYEKIDTGPSAPSGTWSVYRPTAIALLEPR